MPFCKVCETQYSIFGDPNRYYVCRWCRPQIKDNEKYKDFKLATASMISDLFECDVPPASVLFGNPYTSTPSTSTSNTADNVVAPLRRARKQVKVTPEVSMNILSKTLDPIDSIPTFRIPKQIEPSFAPSCFRKIPEPVKKIRQTKQSQKKKKSGDTSLIRRSSKRVKKQRTKFDNSGFVIHSIQRALWSSRLTRLRKRVKKPILPQQPIIYEAPLLPMRSKKEEAAISRLSAKEARRAARKTAEGPPAVAVVKPKIRRLPRNNRFIRGVTTRSQASIRLLKNAVVAASQQVKNPVKQDTAKTDIAKVHSVVGFGQRKNNKISLAYVWMPRSVYNPVLSFRTIVLGYGPRTQLATVDSAIALIRSVVRSYSSATAEKNDSTLALPEIKTDINEDSCDSFDETTHFPPKSPKKSLLAVNAAIVNIRSITRAIEADNNEEVTHLVAKPAINSLKSIDAAIALLTSAARSFFSPNKFKATKGFPIRAWRNAKALKLKDDKI